MDPLLAGLQGGDEDVYFPATFPSWEMIAFDNLVAPRIPSLHFEQALIIALFLTKESILAQYASSLMCLPLLPGSDINAVATPAMAVVAVVVIIVVIVVIVVVAVVVVVVVGGDWSVPNNSQSISAIRRWTSVVAPLVDLFIQISL